MPALVHFGGIEEWALEMGWKEAQAQGATCQTRDTLQLPGCAHTPCWNSSRARARLPARASSTPHVCAQHPLFEPPQLGGSLMLEEREIWALQHLRTRSTQPG